MKLSMYSLILFFALSLLAIASAHAAQRARARCSILSKAIHPTAKRK